MDKCQIRWINKDGSPTPDDNLAVAKIRCTFKSIMVQTGIDYEPSDEYLICPYHLRQAIFYPDWEVTALLVSNPAILTLSEMPTYRYEDVCK